MTTSFDPKIVVRPRSLDQTVDLALAYIRISIRDFAPLLLMLTGVSLAFVAAADFVFDIGERLPIALVIVAPLTERAVTVYGGRHLFGRAILRRRAGFLAIYHLPFALLASVFANVPLILIMIDLESYGPGLIGIGVLMGLGWPFLLAPHLYLREVSMLEHFGPRKAMERSRLLMQHRIERAVGLLIIGLMLRVAAAVLAYTWTWFLGVFVFQFSNLPNALLGWMTAAGWVLAGQFLALVRLFDYVDARTRREGWDIQIRFDAIKQRDDKARARRMAA